MSKSTGVFLAILASVSLVLGYNYFFQPLASFGLPAPTPETVLSNQETTSPAEEAASLVRELSPLQLAWQLMSVPVTVANISAPVDVRVKSVVKLGSLTDEASVSAWLASRNPGSVLLFGQNISTHSAQQAITIVKPSSELSPNFDLRIPLLMVDHEGGSVQRFKGDGFTVLPSWQEYCTGSTDETAAYDTLITDSATELAQLGIDVVLAPVIDLADQHPILKTRVCDGDPVTVATKAGAWIERWQAVGIMPVLKHFPGIGQTKKDLHTTFEVVTVAEPEALLYRALLTEYSSQPLGVMVAHVGITNQFPDIPCSLSIDCVRQLTQNFPQVLVMTDALDMVSAQGPEANPQQTLAELAEAAVRAGEQQLIFEAGVTEIELDQIANHLAAVAEQEPVFKARLETAAQVVVITKMSAQRQEE